MTRKDDCISRDEVCRYVAEFVNHEFSTREEEELIDNIITGIEHMPPVTPQEPILEKINKMKSEIADSLEFWDYSPNNNPLARDMLETLTNFWGDMREVEE